MTATTLQPADAPANTHAIEQHQWLPVHRMRSYAIARVIGGALFAAIFVGWIFIQWSSPAMRIIASSLVVITVWVTLGTIIRDARRAAGRQITAKPGALEITNHDGMRTVRMTDVGRVAWQEESADTFGLWFYDTQDNVLARLDENYLDSEAEARTFIGWVHARMDVPFKVSWPRATT